MSLNLKDIPATGGKLNKQVAMEAGTYPCRVVQIIDLGIQNQRAWEGEAKPPGHEVMFTYEFTDEFCLDEEGKELENKPRWLSETFVLYGPDADLAKSTKRYLALDPEQVHEWDVTKLLSVPGNVTISNREGKGANKGNFYNNVMSVTTMRTRDVNKTPDLVNPPKLFNLDDPDMEVFGSLPNWLQEKIGDNLSFRGSKLEQLMGKAVVDDEPEEPAVDGDNEPAW